MEIDTRIKPVHGVVIRRTEKQLIGSNPHRGRARRPNRKQTLRNWTDLSGRDGIERHRGGSTWIMDLFTRIRAVAGAVEATSAQSRKIATAEGSIRYRVTSYCSASVGADSLTISEEE